MRSRTIRCSITACVLLDTGNLGFIKEKDYYRAFLILLVCLLCMIGYNFLGFVLCSIRNTYEALVLKPVASTLEG